MGFPLLLVELVKPGFNRLYGEHLTLYQKNIKVLIQLKTLATFFKWSHKLYA